MVFLELDQARKSLVTFQQFHGDVWIPNPSRMPHNEIGVRLQERHNALVEAMRSGDKFGIQRAKLPLRKVHPPTCQTEIAQQDDQLTVDAQHDSFSHTPT